MNSPSPAIQEYIEVLTSNKITHKVIDFPKSEHNDIKRRFNMGLSVFTIRVDTEYNKYKEGETLRTPWNQLVVVVEIRKLNSIEEYPFYEELTYNQKRYLSKFNQLDMIELKKK